MNAPKEIWVVVDCDGQIASNPKDCRMWAEEICKYRNAEPKSRAPHTVHRYVKEDEK